MRHVSSGARHGWHSQGRERHAQGDRTEQTPEILTVNDDGAAAKTFDASPRAMKCSPRTVSTVAIALLVVAIASLGAATRSLFATQGGSTNATSSPLIARVIE